MLGVVTASLFFLNLLFWGSILFVVGGLAAVCPPRFGRGFLQRLMARLPVFYCGSFRRIWWLTFDPRLHVEGLEGLSDQAWYVIVANHQSWIDILLLQTIFHIKKNANAEIFHEKRIVVVPGLRSCVQIVGFSFHGTDFERRSLKRSDPA